MRSWKKVIVLATLLMMIGPQVALATIGPGYAEQKPTAGQLGENTMVGDMVSGEHLFETRGRVRWFGNLFYYQILALYSWISWLNSWTR